MRREWDPEDLIACWTLIDSDWALVGNKTGATRLGFVALLKFFELEARFPRHGGELPSAAVGYLADQVKVDPSLFGEYAWSGRTMEYHRAQIRAALGFREPTVADEDTLAGWLAEEVCPVELSEDRLREALLARCRAERMEPPAPGRGERILGAARSAFERKFTARISGSLSDPAIERLEQLVLEENSLVAGGGGGSLLAELKADPGQLGLETLLKEIEKLELVRALGLPSDLFADVSEKLIVAWRARAAKLYPPTTATRPSRSG